MKKREVTEQDFRMPEYRDAKPEDYEFDGNGKLARKDRWEQGIRGICCIVGGSPREPFDIQSVVRKVGAVAAYARRVEENVQRIKNISEDLCGVRLRMSDHVDVDSQQLVSELRALSQLEKDLDAVIGLMSPVPSADE